MSEVKDGGILVTTFPKNKNKRNNSKKVKTSFGEKLKVKVAPAGRNTVLSSTVKLGKLNAQQAAHSHAESIKSYVQL